MKRTIYIGDIHGSKFFEEFIIKYNDGNTIFISLGDIFDRGSESYKNYKIIKRLYGEGKFKMVLGNHDLFFIFGIGLNEEYDGFLLKKITDNSLINHYKFFGKEAFSLLKINGGDKTLNSILEKKEGKYSSYKYSLSKKEQNKRLNEIAEFLFNNFNIFDIYDNNLLIHAGIPFFKDGKSLSLEINGKILSGMKLLEEVNKNFKNLDLEVLKLLTTCNSKKYEPYLVKSLLERLNIEENIDIGNFDQSDLSYTWMNNSSYFSNEKIRLSIKNFLIENNINYIIVGHWFNDIHDYMFQDINSDYWKHLLSQKNSIIRLERNSVTIYDEYNNFGYIINDNGNFIKSGDIVYDHFIYNNINK